MPVRGKPAFEQLSTPGCAGIVSKEIPPHVVIEADDVEALVGKEQRGLRADEPCRASDQNDRHAMVAGPERPGETLTPCVSSTAPVSSAPLRAIERRRPASSRPSVAASSWCRL